MFPVWRIFFFHEPFPDHMAINTRAFLRLVLFDIDGTLISTNGIARASFADAAHEVFGVETVARTHPFAGKTDPQIYNEVTAASGIARDVAERERERLFTRFFELLDARIGEGDVKVHAGVRELLAALAEIQPVTLGLLTGNMLRGARIKLAPPGLNDYFGFGAFGSDATYRYELPAIALERAYTRTGYVFREKEIVIIGDTPHDIECGRHLNVRSIAVATGGASREELAAHTPDFLFDDLSDTEHVIEAITQ